MQTRQELKNVEGGMEYLKGEFEKFKAEVAAKLQDKDGIIRRRDERIDQLQVALSKVSKESEARDEGVVHLTDRIDALAAEVML